MFNLDKLYLYNYFQNLNRAETGLMKKKETDLKGCSLLKGGRSGGFIQ